MRKLSSLAFAAMMSVTAFATPASAQQMSASGACGPSADNVNFHDVNVNMINPSGGDSVPALFYRVDYSGVPAPTTVGVIVRYNGELESQSAVSSFTAQNASGSQPGALTSAGVQISEGHVVGVNPDLVATSGSVDKNTGNPGGAGFSPGENRARRGAKDGPHDYDVPGGNGPQGGAGPNTGVTPGEYVFYVYTGSTGDVYNVKDGTVARNAFIADEKGFLGTFSCGVSANGGGGPG